MNPRLRPLDSATLDLFASPARGDEPERETGAASNYWDHCPNCGARLQNQRCTYRCTRCTSRRNGSDVD